MMELYRCGIKSGYLNIRYGFSIFYYFYLRRFALSMDRFKSTSEAY